MCFLERYLPLGPENCFSCKAEKSLFYEAKKDIIAVVTTYGNISFTYFAYILIYYFTFITMKYIRI